ncbi:MAG TPA: malonyl-[acyl-carrier protein] O-methyltransferase BioC, partial [Gallionellaceae bacterium]|nr:malonyl-[acyl-carrier protein] O-methyltransferase BioC [Gallionellaceae bacterium]
MNEFLIDKREVRRAFSRAAHNYDAAAVLQREVCGRMLERLGYIKLQPQR